MPSFLDIIAANKKKSNDSDDNNSDHQTEAAAVVIASTDHTNTNNNNNNNHNNTSSSNKNSPMNQKPSRNSSTTAFVEETSFNANNNNNSNINNSNINNDDGEFTYEVFAIHNTDHITVLNKRSNSYEDIQLAGLVRVPKLPNPTHARLCEPHAWEAREVLRKNFLGRPVDLTLVWVPLSQLNNNDGMNPSSPTANISSNSKFPPAKKMFHVTRADGESIVSCLVKRGLAECRPNFLAKLKGFQFIEEILQNAQNEAQRSKIGLWTDAIGNGRSLETQIQTLAFPSRDEFFRTEMIVASVLGKWVKISVEKCVSVHLHEAVLANSLQEVKFKIAGLLAPDFSDVFQEGRLRAMKKLLHRMVEVKFVDYDRSCGMFIVTFKDERAERLVRDGFALIDRKTLHLSNNPEMLLVASATAIRNRCGIFAETHLLITDNVDSKHIFSPQHHEFVGKVVGVPGEATVTIKPVQFYLRDYREQQQFENNENSATSTYQHRMGSSEDFSRQNSSAMMMMGNSRQQSMENNNNTSSWMANNSNEQQQSAEDEKLLTEFLNKVSSKHLPKLLDVNIAFVHTDTGIGSSANNNLMMNNDNNNSLCSDFAFWAKSYHQQQPKADSNKVSDGKKQQAAFVANKNNNNSNTEDPSSFSLILETTRSNFEARQFLKEELLGRTVLVKPIVFSESSSFAISSEEDLRHYCPTTSNLSIAAKDVTLIAEMMVLLEENNNNDNQSSSIAAAMMQQNKPSSCFRVSDQNTMQITMNSSSTAQKSEECSGVEQNNTNKSENIKGNKKKDQKNSSSTRDELLKQMMVDDDDDNDGGKSQEPATQSFTNNNKTISTTSPHQLQQNDPSTATANFNNNSMNTSYNNNNNSTGESLVFVDVAMMMICAQKTPSPRLHSILTSGSTSYYFGSGNNNTNNNHSSASAAIASLNVSPSLQLLTTFETSPRMIAYQNAVKKRKNATSSSSSPSSRKQKDNSKRSAVEQQERLEEEMVDYFGKTIYIKKPSHLDRSYLKQQIEYPLLDNLLGDDGLNHHQNKKKIASNSNNNNNNASVAPFLDEKIQLNKVYKASIESCEDDLSSFELILTHPPNNNNKSDEIIVSSLHCSLAFFQLFCGKSSATFQRSRQRLKIIKEELLQGELSRRQFLVQFTGDIVPSATTSTKYKKYDYSVILGMLNNNNASSNNTSTSHQQSMTTKNQQQQQQLSELALLKQETNDLINQSNCSSLNEVLLFLGLGFLKLGTSTTTTLAQFYRTLSRSYFAAIAQKRGIWNTEKEQDKSMRIEFERDPALYLGKSKTMTEENDENGGGSTSTKTHNNNNNNNSSNNTTTILRKIPQPSISISRVWGVDVNTGMLAFKSHDQYSVLIKDALNYAQLPPLTSFYDSALVPGQLFVIGIGADEYYNSATYGCVLPDCPIQRARVESVHRGGGSSSSSSSQPYCVFSLVDAVHKNQLVTITDPHSILEIERVDDQVLRDENGNLDLSQVSEETVQTVQGAIQRMNTLLETPPLVTTAKIAYFSSEMLCSQFGNACRVTPDTNVYQFLDKLLCHGGNEMKVLTLYESVTTVLEQQEEQQVVVVEDQSSNKTAAAVAPTAAASILPPSKNQRRKKKGGGKEVDIPDAAVVSVGVSQQSTPATTTATTTTTKIVTKEKQYRENYVLVHPADTPMYDDDEAETLPGFDYSVALQLQKRICMETGLDFDIRAVEIAPTVLVDGLKS